jgi:hypothetical protein
MKSQLFNLAEEQVGMREIERKRKERRGKNANSSRRKNVYSVLSLKQRSKLPGSPFARSRFKTVSRPC